MRSHFVLSRIHRDRLAEIAAAFVGTDQQPVTRRNYEGPLSDILTFLIEKRG
ncbi:MAG: hypothetical protein ACRERU_08850 [Methylococcales bacterium]